MCLHELFDMFQHVCIFMKYYKYFLAVYIVAFVCKGIRWFAVYAVCGKLTRIVLSMLATRKYVQEFVLGEVFNHKHHVLVCSHHSLPEQ